MPPTLMGLFDIKSPAHLGIELESDDRLIRIQKLISGLVTLKEASAGHLPRRMPPHRRKGITRIRIQRQAYLAPVNRPI